MSFDAAPPPPPSLPSILIRSVWSHNVEQEFKVIREIIDDFPFVSMDTEFPGVVFKPDSGHHRHHQDQKPAEHYVILKSNVDALNIIQVGITLSDADGNLPDLGTPHRYIWEFNFRDFDVARDQHAADSIELLRRHGMDFDKNRELGIDSVVFAELMMSSGLVCNDLVSWVTFHSGYDFGYLIKILRGEQLPTELTQFHELKKSLFGDKVYDVKHVMKDIECLFGGLDKVADTLQVKRAVGNSHQAGSDSLLTLLAFQKIKNLFCKDGIEKYAGVLFGLEVS